MALIIADMTLPRSRQVVVKKMLELAIISDRQQVRRKRSGKSRRRARNRNIEGVVDDDDGARFADRGELFRDVTRDSRIDS